MTPRLHAAPGSAAWRKHMIKQHTSIMNRGVKNSWHLQKLWHNGGHVASGMPVENKETPMAVASHVFAFAWLQEVSELPLSMTATPVANEDGHLPLGIPKQK